MISAQARILASRTRLWSAEVPLMLPFASLVLLLAGLFLLVYYVPQPAGGLVRTEQRPFNIVMYCSPPDNPHDAVISLTRQNRLSFSLTNSQKLQAAAINQVAARHGVKLTSSQRAALETLPFLATDVRQLPAVLALPAAKRDQLIYSGAYNTLSKTQLNECITAAKEVVAKATYTRVYVGLNIDTDTKAAQVMSLIHSLQDVDVNRFNLLTKLY
jgi:biopolymer transport protein ExbD